MSIQPKYVTFEQAKLLKEKDFDEYCDAGYNRHTGKLDTENAYHKNSHGIWISAPEYWMVIEWLRLHCGV